MVPIKPASAPLQLTTTTIDGPLGPPSKLLARSLLGDLLALPPSITSWYVLYSEWVYAILCAGHENCV